jgi:SAM-dependent methyltransferase
MSLRSQPVVSKMNTRLLAAIVLLFSVGFVALGRAGQTTTSNPAGVQTAREFWNKEFAKDKALRDKQPSKLLVDALRGRKPGAALDLGMGQGRNAVFLAEQGWRVTGVDLSDVAVEQAKRNAAARGVTITGVVENLDIFDFGTEQWDLITLFYMHSWHRRSSTHPPQRVFQALRRGGLLVIEGFADPPNQAGLKTEELARVYSAMRILRNENVKDFAAWYVPEPTPLVRFVAEKP